MIHGPRIWRVRGFVRPHVGLFRSVPMGGGTYPRLFAVRSFVDASEEAEGRGASVPRG